MQDRNATYSLEETDTKCRMTCSLRQFGARETVRELVGRHPERRGLSLECDEHVAVRDVDHKLSHLALDRVLACDDGAGTGEGGGDSDRHF